MDFLFLQLIKIISSVEHLFMRKECFQTLAQHPASCPRIAARDTSTYLFLPSTVTETADALPRSGMLHIQSQVEDGLTLSPSGRDYAT